MEGFLPTVKYGDKEGATTLQCQRDQLLEKIQAEEGTQERHDTGHLRARYNNVMDQLSTLRCGPFSDPIESLPHELWIQIFKEVIAHYGDEIQGSLILTLVSIRWRDAIMNTPELWTQITVDGGIEDPDPDMLAKLTTAFTLSGNFNVQLQLHDSNPYWGSILPLIKSHATRIAAIRICATRGPWIHMKHDAIKFIALFGSMPSLRSLRYDDVSCWQDLGDILIQTPGIVTLEGFTLQKCNMEHPHLRNLQNYITKEQLSELLTYPEFITRLKSLTMYYKSYREKPKSRTDSGKDTMIPLTVQPLELQHFIYCQADYKLALHVVRTSLSLTTLDISFEMEWIWLVELLKILPQLPLLEDLSMQLEFSSSRIEFPLAYSVASLKALSITIPDLSRPGPSIEVVEVWHHNILKLFNYMHASFKFVQDLSLTSVDEDAHIQPSRTFHEVSATALTYINSLTNLRSLYLQLPKKGLFLPLGACIEPQLENLEILGGMDSIEAFISTAHLCRPVTLSCTETSTSPQPSPLIAKMNPAISNYLQILCWSWCPVIISDFGVFNSLRTVDFDYCGAAVTSDFCIQIILRPYACPRLEQIRFHERRVEWDWLVLMLERRNLLRNQDVSPIRSMSFPFLVSPSISRTLVTLLHRKLPHRASYQELSLKEVSYIYFDATIKKCHSCCFAFKKCDITAKFHLSGGVSRSSREAPVIRDLDIGIADPPLPYSIAQWLKDRPNRHLHWNQLLKDSYVSRIYACDAYHYSDDTILTEFSPLLPPDVIYSAM